MRALILALLCVMAISVYADNSTQLRYYQVAQEHTTVELQSIFQNAEEWQQQQTNQLNPLVVVLTGDELRLFNRKYYRENKELIDWAARLSAFGALELRAIERELTFRHMEASDVPAFLVIVGTFEAELQSLESQGYQAYQAQ